MWTKTTVYVEYVGKKFHSLLLQKKETETETEWQKKQNKGRDGRIKAVLWCNKPTMNFSNMMKFWEQLIEDNSCISFNQ